MRQLDQRVLTEAQASKNLWNSRNANKADYDANHRLRAASQQLHIGDLVLLHNTKASYSRARAHKLDDRWLGPYRIRQIPDDSTFYWLEELDGTPLATTFTGNHLKQFFSRTELDNCHAETHETIRVRDALDEDEQLRSGDDGDM